jgi:hypothetical protein
MQGGAAWSELRVRDRNGIPLADVLLLLAEVGCQIKVEEKGI